MAANFFREADRLPLIARLQQLNAASPRRWGTLTAAGMCWHCRQQLEFLLNPPAEVKYMNSFLRYQPFRWLAIFVIPWPKGSPTAPSIDTAKVNPDLGDLETEKTKLLEAAEAVSKLSDFRAGHPLFGMLDRHYWGRLIWKHLDHHLRQFGG